MPRERSFIRFDNNNFKKKLSELIKKAAYEIANKAVETIQRNVYAIPFKSNEVRLAGGGKTSDYQRKKALINSIQIRDMIDSYGYFNIGIEAMRENFDESFVGWFYEYGTGVYEEENRLPYDSLEDPNPYRDSKVIVSRSRHVNNGLWRDAGGNMRITGSFAGGTSSKRFRDYIGEDIRPYHWFRDAVYFAQIDTMKILEKYMFKLNISSFIKTYLTFRLGE